MPTHCFTRFEKFALVSAIQLDKDRAKTMPNLDWSAALKEDDRIIAKVKAIPTCRSPEKSITNQAFQLLPTRK
jgi:hypothetical protein